MQAAGSALLARYDAVDPEVVANPYPEFARLRAAGPLCRIGPGTYGVVRHAEVAALQKDPRLSHSFPKDFYRLSVGDGPTAEWLPRLMAGADPPEHTRLRRLVAVAFRPHVIRNLRPRIEQLVDGYIEAGLERGEFDAVRDLAFPLTTTLLCELIGIPSERWPEMPQATDLGLAFTGRIFDRPDAGAEAADEALEWMRALIRELIEMRRREPAEDLLSDMLAAEADGDRLTYEEIVDNTLMTFGAGFETSIGMIATGYDALLDHPGELRRLRDDPSLVPLAVEEFLRYDAPIQAGVRRVLEPVEIGGRVLRPGRALVLLIGAANHDERVFADPARLDVGRDPNPHVSFGGGWHLCLGAALSRLEGEIVFGRLLERFSSIERAAPAVRRPSPNFRTLDSVPVRVRP
ncbi:cytochrome P450 [Nonomuraea muscovyensis]